MFWSFGTPRARSDGRGRSPTPLRGVAVGDPLAGSRGALPASGESRQGIHDPAGEEPVPADPDPGSVRSTPQGSRGGHFRGDSGPEAGSEEVLPSRTPYVGERDRSPLVGDPGPYLRQPPHRADGDGTARSYHVAG